MRTIKEIEADLEAAAHELYEAWKAWVAVRDVPAMWNVWKVWKAKRKEAAWHAAFDRTDALRDELAAARETQR